MGERKYFPRRLIPRSLRLPPSLLSAFLTKRTSGYAGVTGEGCGRRREGGKGTSQCRCLILEIALFERRPNAGSRIFPATATASARRQRGRERRNAL